ncbi:MAG: hypothetical protein R3F05_20470 [Planctomycetota bacterium]
MTTQADYFYAVRRDEGTWPPDVLAAETWRAPPLEIDEGSADDSSFSVGGARITLSLDAPCLVIAVERGKLDAGRTLDIVDLICSNVERATGHDVLLFASPPPVGPAQLPRRVARVEPTWLGRALPYLLLLVCAAVLFVPFPQTRHATIHLEGRLAAAYFEAGPGPYCLVARPASGIPDLEATCRTASGWTDENGKLRIAIGGGRPDRVAIVWKDDSAFTLHVFTDRPRWRSAAGLVSWYSDWHPRDAVADLAILRHGETAVTISLPDGVVSEGDRDGDVTWNVGEISAGQNAR